MQTVIFLVMCSAVYVTSVILEVPSECTFSSFNKASRLAFKKQSPLDFTVDNAARVAADALRRSRKVYTTNTMDTFSIKVRVPWVGIKPAFVTNQLCCSAKGMSELGVEVAVFPGTQTFIENFKFTDTSIWTRVCWSRPGLAYSRVSLTFRLGNPTGQVKKCMMKYCLSPVVVTTPSR